MAWWSAIPGIGSLIKGAGGAVKDVAHVWKEDAEAGAQRAHAERMALSEQDMASLQQFAAEFHAREGRTWWDSLVDGLNRLPRPLITLGVLAFFVLAPYDPAYFLEIAKAYEVIPDGFWALLGVVVAFYFGGRMQIKRQDMAVKGHAVQAAKDLIAMRRELREMRQQDRAGQPSAGNPDATEPTEPSKPIEPNRVIEEWQRRRQSQAAGA